MMVQKSTRERNILSSYWTDSKYQVPMDIISLVTEALGPWLRRGLKHEPLSPGQSWEVARQLVEATRYMHSMNIVHGSKFLPAPSCTKGYLEL